PAQERQACRPGRPQWQAPASDRRSTTDSAPASTSSAGSCPAADELPRLLTIGHSNRSLNEFTELLTGTGTDVVVDVRRLPGSNRYPQFNADALEADLDEIVIDLRRLGGPTGPRPGSRPGPCDTNTRCRNGG